MPELPEVETVVRGLAPDITGRTLGTSWVDQGVNYYNETQPNKMAYVTGITKPVTESTNDLAATQIGLGAVALGNASLVNQVETYFANPTNANMQAVLNGARSS